MSSTQLFMTVDQDLTYLPDSGPTKAMWSTPLMTGLARVGQDRPLIKSPS